MSKVNLIRTNMDLKERLPQENDVLDDTLIPLEDAAFLDTKENNEYWDQMGDTDEAKDMKNYIRSSKLPVLQKESIIRAPDIRACPFGLPIPFACNNAGNTTDQMTAMNDIPKEERAKYAKLNKRVYVYSQTGERCQYADRIVENSDRVHCDYGDSGAGERDFSQNPNQNYPRAFNGTGMYAMYSYPLGNYSDTSGAMGNFAGAYSVYAHSNSIHIEKQALVSDYSESDIAIIKEE